MALGPLRPDTSRLYDVLTVQRVDRLRLGRREAGQVHDPVRPQPGDQRPELASLFGSLPVAGLSRRPASWIVAVSPT